LDSPVWEWLAMTSTFSDLPHVVAFAGHPAGSEDGCATRYARTFHFVVAWSEVTTGARLRHAAGRESFVVLPDAGVEFVAGGTPVSAPAHSICILPAGESTIVARRAGTVIRLIDAAPAEVIARAVNAPSYEAPRDDLRPIGTPFRRIGPAAPRVYPLDTGSGGKPQSFQTETMSCGWFEQTGPHDPASVFPHAHVDFEEGSLMVEGAFVQHLRFPWGTDMREWRADEHLRCGPGTLVVIPPKTLHVAEAVGPERHVLMNLFAPPRPDHLAKGQIRNADEYTPASGKS
jgi:mannose-6-phosphate isomerase-like protein (cupin superfamily)